MECRMIVWIMFMSIKVTNDNVLLLINKLDKITNLVCVDVKAY